MNYTRLITVILKIFYQLNSDLKIQLRVSFSNLLCFQASLVEASSKSSFFKLYLE